MASWEGQLPDLPRVIFPLYLSASSRFFPWGGGWRRCK